MSKIRTSYRNSDNQQLSKNEVEKVLENHEKWLKNQKGGERAILRGAILRGIDLSGANLRGIDLRGIDLSGADLSGVSLRRTDLSGADLRGTNLSGADIDYSTWPLWCGSLGVMVDARIASQLAYHFCRLNCQDPEYLEVRNAVAKFANKFHRVGECGEIE